MIQKPNNPDILGLHYDVAAGQWEIWDGSFMIATAAEESYARLLAAAPALLNDVHKLLSPGGKLPRAVETSLRETIDFVANRRVKKQSPTKKPAASKRSPAKKR